MTRKVYSVRIVNHMIIWQQKIRSITPEAAGVRKFQKIHLNDLRVPMRLIFADVLYLALGRHTESRCARYR